jgi:hypothetical protein
MDVVLASGGLKIVAHGGRFGVFVSNKQGGWKEADWFDKYADASKLSQDLFVAQATSDDPIIGDRKYCPNAMGNGQIVVVVAKTKNGYIVQPTGTTVRLEVSADVLSNPMTMEELALIDQEAATPAPQESGELEE